MVQRGERLSPSTVYQFPIVIYPSEDSDGGRVTAHCLTMDVLADHDTVEGAVSDLLETIEAALEAAEKHNANVFREAPQEYWDKLEHATRVPPELMERIVFNANKRLAGTSHPLVDVEKQCDVRQLQLT